MTETSTYVDGDVVLGYGSLLNPSEIDRTAGMGYEATPVKVEGWTRTFDQETVWRPTEGSERAVLTVEPSDDWINAVLITDLSEGDFENFETREAGYRSETVPRDSIEPYDDGSVDVDEALISVGTRRRDDIDPIPSYVELCLEGAAEWGDEFLRDFVETTRWPEDFELQSFEQVDGLL